MLQVDNYLGGNDKANSTPGRIHLDNLDSIGILDGIFKVYPVSSFSVNLEHGRVWTFYEDIDILVINGCVQLQIKLWDPDIFDLEMPLEHLY